MTMLIEEHAQEVRRIIAEGLLHPVFQPILDFRARAYLGYEALIRGPVNSPLHRPDQLFAAAHHAGVARELEHACREASLRAFAHHRLPGRLFLNVTPGCLLDERLMNGETRQLLSDLGIAANRVVIELTENEQIVHIPGIQEALLHYRGQGFQIAIDDLGEGFANLRMWSEVQPEFVKIDKHFVHGIADDRIKYHFVRAMQDLAEICNASLVAEGIERAEDFACIRDMGISCVQGYFVAMPEAVPVRQLRTAVIEALGHQRVSLSPGGAKTATALNLLRPIEPVLQDATNECVITRFEANPDLDVLPVVNGDLPVGMINRHSMIDRFARPFRKELFGRKSCEQFMDHAPLIVDQHATLQELAMMLALAPKHYLFDGFIVTGNGKYLGVGSSHDLMAMITEMQIMQVLGKARDQTGQIAGRHLGLGNSAVVMAVSGARGSMLNLTQMAGCIGQQSVRGERIVRGYDDRTLPHFKKGDRGSDAHGFIAHSYKGGLNPTEFFFHAIGGREGLVDTAVRTSQSGYLQRRMINALQDLKVAYDGTVRTTGGRIIQFQYGEDSTDPTKSAFGDPVDVKGIVEAVLKEEV